MERPVIRKTNVRVLKDYYDGKFKVGEVYPCWVWEDAPYPYYLTDDNQPVTMWEETGEIAVEGRHFPHAPDEVEEVQ